MPIGFSAVDARSTRMRAAEPQLKIPQPPGWQRVSMLDSEVIRFTMGNKALSARNFMPTAVVTLESIPGGHADSPDDLRPGTPSVGGAPRRHRFTASPRRRCAETRQSWSNYDAPSDGPDSAAQSQDADGDSFIRRQHLRRDRHRAVDRPRPTPSYARDADAILTGFQILPPEAG